MFTLSCFLEQYVGRIFGIWVFLGLHIWYHELDVGLWLKIWYLNLSRSFYWMFSSQYELQVFLQRGCKKYKMANMMRSNMKMSVGKYSDIQHHSDRSKTPDQTLNGFITFSHSQLQKGNLKQDPTINLEKLEDLDLQLSLRFDHKENW